MIRGLLEADPSKRLKIDTTLSWDLFSNTTKSEILAYLREFVQTLQWEKRVKGVQKNLTSAQQLPLPHFTGYVRRPILENKIIDKLLNEKTTTVSCVGMGGIGKTQLLTYLVYAREVQSGFTNIFWFRSVDVESSLDIQYYGLAQELKLIEEKIPSLRDREGEAESSRPR